MRIRAAFAKGEEARFIGHLDLTKVFERAMRRASIPMAFSEGFNPHPKMAFGSALALGATSLREYVDIELAQRMELGEFVQKLQGQLPPGLTLLEARENIYQCKPLMAVLNCSNYVVTIPMLPKGVDAELVSQRKLEDTIDRFLAKPVINFVRNGKKGRQEKDLRPYVRKLSGEAKENHVVLTMEMAITNNGSVKPVELAGVLRDFGSLPLDVEGSRVHRTSIYIINSEGKVISPLDEQQGAAG